MKPTASELLDGPVAPDQAAAEAAVAAAPAVAPTTGAPAVLVYAAQPATAPAVAAAAQAAGARRLGRQALDALGPSQTSRSTCSTTRTPGRRSLAAPLKTPPLHPKIYDASEGTALDPLRDKGYDLNSGKSIPAEFGSEH